ncbi:putative NAD(P)-binding protein [Seiridium unicorne]|uniref:NAD(P)-binding protein n=1 Tax=Seiridium unicorne TaxID=138068 RepID=A0ABR2UFD9_9PEZI
MASPDVYTAPFMLTKSMHRDVYPAVDPAKNKDLDASTKVIAIFGATSGLGFAVAKSWSSAKAKGIVLVGRNGEGLQKAEKDLASGSEVLSVVADVTSFPGTESVFKKALEKFGHVDVVVNAFGAMNVAPVGSQGAEAWWENFEVNVKGVYNVSHSYISATGGKGTIINIVSLAASFVAPAMSGYSASKLATVKLAECLDVEQPDLRVFSIHPGMVVSENGRGMIVEPFIPFTKDTAALTGGLTLYLATPKAEFLKGGYIHANWDVEELEQHKDEIVEKKLVRLAFLNGQLQPGGHPWAS